MSRYNLALNQAIDNVGNVTLSLRAGATAGLGLTGFYLGYVETGTFGGRIRLFRAAADGSGGSAATPEKLSSRSGTVISTGHSDYTTSDPAITGSDLIALGTVAGTALMRVRRWSAPNPRYPVYDEPSGNYLCVAASGTVITTSTIIGFDEPHPSRYSFGWLRGRRSRTPGAFTVADASGNFQGLSTSPKNGGSTHSYNIPQPADWPETVVQNALNLLLAVADGITGTAEFTESGESLDASGAETFTGTAGFTESGEALAASGAETFTGTAGFTESGEALAASGAETFSGTAEFTESGEALAASGAETFTGTAEFTESGQALAASGAETFTGDAAFTESGEALAATGAVGGDEITGAAGFEQAGLEQAATGEVIGPVVPQFVGGGAWRPFTRIPRPRESLEAVGRFEVPGLALSATGQVKLNIRGRAVFELTPELHGRGKVSMENRLEEEAIALVAAHYL